MTRRPTWLLALAAAAALAVAPVAGAKDKSTLKLSKGTTTVKVDPGVLSALGAAGVTVVPDGTTTASGGVFVFKLTHGRVAKDLSSGRIEHNGGVTLSKGATVVKLGHPRIALAGADSKLSVRVQGKRVDLATLGLGGLTPTVTRTSLTLTGVTLTLTQAAADALNQAFGTAFPAGATLGTADVVAKIVGKGAKNQGPKPPHVKSGDAQGKSGEAHGKSGEAHGKSGEDHHKS